VSDLASVAAAGVRVATLEALRDRLALEIDAGESARDVSSLSQRLMDVLTEIADLAPPVKAKGSPLDELAKRRSARVATPARKARAKVAK